ncbi:MAG: restriction endonuclease subunit S [Hyphomicrobium sp.]
MVISWPSVQLEEVAPIVRRPVAAEAGHDYPIIAARGFGRGTFHQPIVNGTELTWQRLFQVRAGDLLVSNIKAWEGAVAVVSGADDGMYCSHRYLTCVSDTQRLLPDWLGLFFKTPSAIAQLSAASPGSADRNRTLSMDGLRSIKIPLPPLDEQRRIVARIDELASKIAMARGLRSGVAEESNAIWQRCAREMLLRLPTSVARRPLSSLIDMRGGGTPSKSEPRFWKGNIPWITPKDMKRRELSDAIDHISEEATVESPAKLIAPGAVLVVVRGMILAHTFPVAVLRSRAAINQDMKALVPTADITPEYLASVLWALNRDVLAMVDRSSHDTRKLLTDKLEAFRIPVPSIVQQRRIVADLDATLARVEEVKRLQAASAAELDALLPAILDRAFKGEL